MIYWLWLPPSERITDPFWEIRFSHLECVCGTGLQRPCEGKPTLRSSGVWISALSLLCCQWYAQWIALWFSAALSIVLHYLLVDKYSVWARFQYVFIAFQTFKIMIRPLSYHKHAGALLNISLEKKRKIIKTTLALIGGIRLVCWKLWCSRMSAPWIDLAKNTHTPDQSEASMCCGPAGHRGLQASKSSF